MKKLQIFQKARKEMIELRVKRRPLRFKVSLNTKTVARINERDSIKQSKKQQRIFSDALCTIHQ